MTLLDRYDAGDRTSVWDEIHALGPLHALDAHARDDIDGVARRTVERAGVNLKTIHDRLVRVGYHFDMPAFALVPPNADMAVTKARLLETASPVPATLAAWFDLVGYASFRGSPPQWSGAKTWHEELFDPFEFIYGLDAIDSMLEAIEEDPDEFQRPDGTAAFRLEFSADFFHKNDFSGGGMTFASLPAAGADARVFEDNREAYVDFVDCEPGDQQGIWFVDYVRRYFQHGGFRRVRADRTYPGDFFAPLSEGLLSI